MGTRAWKLNMWQKYSQSTCNKAVKNVYNGVTGLYHELFGFMEDEEILDPFNEFDLAAIHYVFLALINSKFDACQQACSKHCMRTIRTFPYLSLGIWSDKLCS